MKKELRHKYKLLRANITNKNNKDIAICSTILNSRLYQEASLILGFYPINSEPNILPILNKVLEDNKKLALPYIIDKGYMKFYYVSNLTELKENSFKIKEPIPNKASDIEDFSSSICLVPGLVFDKFGYRLGYGGGYYDRFLNEFRGISIGITYQELLENELIRDIYDQRVEYIGTNKELTRTLTP